METTITDPVNDLEEGSEPISTEDQEFTGPSEVIGGPGDDVLEGSPEADLILGDSGNDILIGNDGNDTLEGGAGDDNLTGGLGDDLIDGGEGLDTARFDDLDVSVTADLAAGTAERDTGFDVDIDDLAVINPNDGIVADEIISEGIAGNIYFNLHSNDFPGGELRGQLELVTDNRVDGVGTVEFTSPLSGDQEVPPIETDASGTATTIFTVAADGSVTYTTDLALVGLSESDLLPVNIGNGTLSPIHLHNAAAGENGPVVIDIASDAGPEGIVAISETDTLINIENVAGSNDADLIIGDGEANVLEGLDDNDTLEGGAGNDTIEGGAGDDLLQGGGGNDVIDGGDGIDSASFADIGVDVTVALAADGTGTAEYIVDGNTVTDTLTNISGIVGSDNNDTIIATGDAPNTLEGGAGNDTIEGGAGDDLLQGGGGNDVIDGGDGIDSASFADIGVDVTVALAADGTGTAEYIVDGNTVTDTLTNISGIVGSDNNDTIIASGAAPNTIEGGAGDDLIAGGGGPDTLDGGDGIDTNSFQGINADVTADLAAGTASYGEIAETFVNFENLEGSAFNDQLSGDENDNVLTGNNGDDLLSGLDGNDSLLGGVGNDSLQGGVGDDTLQGGLDDDTLQGGGGNDIINGGAGNNTADFSDIGVDVNVNLEAELAEYVVDDNQVQDELLNIENLIGSLNNDTLIGDGENNVLAGGDGNDTLEGGAGGDTLEGGLGDDLLQGGGGNDVIDGGEGIDTASFADIGVDVTVALAADGTGTAEYIVAGNTVSDTLTNIAGIVGSANNDTIIASGAAPNTIDGGDGDDFIAGGGGPDTLDGGDGIDTNSFQGINAEITADLAAGTATYGEIAETFVNFENLDGSALNDQLSGDDNNNDLNGNEGNDLLVGAEGNDNLLGGFGDDTLQGGVGDDTLLGGLDNDTLQGGGGNDSVDGGLGNDTADFSDIGVDVNANLEAGLAEYVVNDNQVQDELLNIENLIGSLNNDTLIGDGENNVLAGGDGNDTLEGGAGGDTLEGGVGDDLLQGGGGNDVIDGGDGIDTASFADIGVDVTVALAADGTGTAEYIVDGNTVTDALTNIAGIVGSENNDTIIASGAAPNTIEGGAGDDLIAGGGGPDTLDGGDGIDTNSFQGINAEIIADLAAGTATYGDIAETFVNFENLDGSDLNDQLSGDENDNVLTGNLGNDTLLGGAGGDTLEGGEGDDFLQGGGGNDVIDGGDGIDTASFADIGVDVTVALAADGTGTAEYIVDGNTVTDTLTNIAGIVGSENNDVIIASGAAPNTIEGGAGDDFIAGGGGPDTLDGGDGIDTNSFQGINAEITADLAAGTATYGEIAETFVNFENLDGSDLNDQLSGDENDNELTGNLGDDLLSGFGGNDTLLGGVGNDSLLGGAGDDTLLGGLGDDLLQGGGGNDIIDGGAGNDTADFSDIGVDVNADLGAGLAQYVVNDNQVQDQLVNIGNLTGSENNDTLTGDENANVLIGNGGVDILNGAGGDDTLIGGAGSDSFVFDTIGIYTVDDFSTSDDVLEVSAFYSTAEDVLGNASQVGADTLVDFGDNASALLLNVDVETLSDNDFVLG